MIGSLVATLGANELHTCYNGAILGLGNSVLFVHRRNRAEKYGCGMDTLEACLLDENFVPKTDFYELNLIDSYSEDPKLLVFKNEIYIVFGGPGRDPSNWRTRALFIAKILIQKDGITIADDSVRKLIARDKLAVSEKNWVPFVDNKELKFIYSIHPHSVLDYEVANDQTIEFSEKYSSTFGFTFPGEPCSGGTPPVLVNESEYLTFFHSVEFSFKKYSESIFIEERKLSHTRHYSMGAYTFSSSPPYQILRVTEQPLVYQGMFTMPNRRVTRDDRVVFPSGSLICDDRIFVSLGENDSCTKIIEYSKSEMLAKMTPVSEGVFSMVHSRHIPCDI